MINEYALYANVRGLGVIVDKLVSGFISKRTLSEDMELNEPLYNAIYYLEKSNEFVNRVCKENEIDLIKNVSWPSMHDMYKRNYEYCCGVLGCFLIGQIASTEALCRTAIEGCVNLHYVSLGDSMGKQIAYFNHHLLTERNQNKDWKASVEKSEYSQKAKDHHFQRIVDKDVLLDDYETALRESLALAGVDYDAVQLKWPNIFDRFKEAKDEVSYRTVYAALCSQAHNDAEDILNKIMARVIGNVSGLEEAQWVEQYSFTLYLVLTAIDYHIMASAMYIARFKISVEELVEYKNKVMESISTVTENAPHLIREKISINESL